MTEFNWKLPLIPYNPMEKINDPAKSCSFWGSCGDNRSTKPRVWRAQWLRRCEKYPSHGNVQPNDCNCAILSTSFNHVPPESCLYFAVATDAVDCLHNHFPIDTCDLCNKQRRYLNGDDDHLIYLFLLREPGSSSIPNRWSSNTSNLPRELIHVLCLSCYLGFEYKVIGPENNPRGNEMSFSDLATSCPFSSIYGITVENNVLNNTWKIHTYTPSMFPVPFGFIMTTPRQLIKSAAQSKLK